MHQEVDIRRCVRGEVQSDQQLHHRAAEVARSAGRCAPPHPNYTTREIPAETNQCCEPFHGLECISIDKARGTPMERSLQAIARRDGGDPPSLFLRLLDVMKATGLGRSTIYRMVEVNRFPYPDRQPCGRVVADRP